MYGVICRLAYYKYLTMGWLLNTLLDKKDVAINGFL